MSTIAAISTAIGTSGIGIIRISGENSKNVLDKIFISAKKREIKSRQMIYGNIVDPLSKKIVDEVLCVFMKGPETYTREDVVEINCHGSVISLQKILELCIKNGARLAEPGEFTKRAFLNGRLDLSQAEAVIDLIKAKSDKTFEVALNQLEGLFSESIRKIRQEILNILVEIAVNIDYSEEDIQVLTYENLVKALENIKEEIYNMLKTADTGRIIKEGLKVSIIGKPNVGKSSLLNALLKEKRAIVTEIPGTTRDTIEEMMTIKGIPVRFTDTAGLRETNDIIEKIGIEKTKEAFNNSDLIIFIIDNSRELNNEDLEIIKHIDGRHIILLINKTDLDKKINKDEIKKLLPNAIMIETSIVKNVGIEEIKDEIVNLVYGDKVKQSDNIVVTNVRHKNLLEISMKSVEDAIFMANKKEAFEIIEIDINSAYGFLGEIIGETVAEDIIDEVFSKFCLGK